MSAHTPGPWFVGFDRTNIVGVDVRFDINSQDRFSIAGGQSQEHIDGILEAECRANGRLIASAPDLLAALEEALEFIEDQEDVVDGNDGQPQPNRAMSLATVLRAALAKATGEAA